MKARKCSRCRRRCQQWPYGLCRTCEYKIHGERGNLERARRKFQIIADANPAPVDWTPPATRELEVDGETFVVVWDGRVHS